MTPERKFLQCLFAAAVFIAFSPAFGQTPIASNIVEKMWKAQWITGPGTEINSYSAASDPSLRDYGVYKFRKAFQLAEKPPTFVVHVSGDNRYKLFVNGKQVSQGPARGDLYFWNFETVDIASHLVSGKNVISAVVWNDGRQKPEAQISYRTGFILQGNTSREEIVNTDETWKVLRDESYHPLPVKVPGYYVAGPGEIVDMNKYEKNFNRIDYDDTNWMRARMIGPGTPKEAAVNSTGWMLVPSPLPQMETKIERLSATRKAEFVTVPATFPMATRKVTVPANTKATILLDQGYLTNAYPTLVISGGKDAAIAMGYAEGMYAVRKVNQKTVLSKDNRNEINGKIFIGKTDSILSNGTANQEYSPLWWRTYRYIQLRIYTHSEPLTIDDLYGTFTGYPFTLNASIKSTNPEFSRMLDIGWRSARLCAFETYMDCPYYEQLQYIGDARIQALVSYFNSGDDRLARNGLMLMDHSRIAEGITQSRYPTDLHQEIPTFSLWWIAMLHDYYRYRADSKFVQGMLPGTRQVMSFFDRYQQPDGSLKDVPYWTFTDWAEGEGWDFGMAPVGSKGESSILDLQLLWIYRQASELEMDLGIKELGATYAARAAQLEKIIQQKYWDDRRKLYADTEERNTFSQHVNALAILAGVSKSDDAVNLGKRLLRDTTLTQASIYFRYYLHQALHKVGLGNDYMNWLGKWRENIALGLSTWAESSDVATSRSDCHAWGASPNIEFFRIVLGIDSDAPGFSRVKIAPSLGALQEIAGEMPHPNGKISVSYKVVKGTLQGDITLPKNTTGSISWNGKTQRLTSGRNVLNL